MLNIDSGERNERMANQFMRADEVAKELGISRSYAYKLIRQLNQELKERGFLTIAGRINRDYLKERLYAAESGVKQNVGLYNRSWWRQTPRKGMSFPLKIKPSCGVQAKDRTPVRRQTSSTTSFRRTI